MKKEVYKKGPLFYFLLLVLILALGFFFIGLSPKISESPKFFNDLEEEIGSVGVKTKCVCPVKSGEVLYDSNCGSEINPVCSSKTCRVSGYDNEGDWVTLPPRTCVIQEACRCLTGGEMHREAVWGNETNDYLVWGRQCKLKENNCPKSANSCNQISLSCVYDCQAIDTDGVGFGPWVELKQSCTTEEI